MGKGPLVPGTIWCPGWCDLMANWLYFLLFYLKNCFNAHIDGTALQTLLILLRLTMPYLAIHSDWTLFEMNVLSKSCLCKMMKLVFRKHYSYFKNCHWLHVFCSVTGLHYPGIGPFIMSLLQQTQMTVWLTQYWPSMCKSTFSLSLFLVVLLCTLLVHTYILHVWLLMFLDIRFYHNNNQVCNCSPK